MLKYPSRFLFEVDRNYYKRIGKISEELEEEARAFHQKVFVTEQSDPKGDGIEIGSKVEHPIFGEGSIESIDTKKNVYMVRFSKINAVRPISKNFKGLKVIS